MWRIPKTSNKVIISCVSFLATCELNVVEHSVAQEKYIYVENEFAKIQCLPGFLINGSSMLQCSSNGSWIGVVPHCRGK